MPENRLAHAASAYLRSARHQPVAWHEWGAEAFALAATEDKPVLLDIGAVWCHWCHVMDRESYESAETAAILNEHFVCIKVDRDERPDVDARYQAAVQAISGQGGWPLTAFLTADGRPFFGGTYFPPEDRYGRPGFPRVLLTMAEAYANKRDEALESAASVMAAIEHSENVADGRGSLSEELLAKLVNASVGQFDARHGGFGSQPKFPHAAALDVLLDAAGHGNQAARHAATFTLHKMADGGVYDQLAGGFHRYSVDERWIVPHFEKMAYDNSELLKAYVHAFQSFGDVRFAEIAREIVAWMVAVLSDRERGGFYASQDADSSIDDDGDYFTWSRAEARAVLTPEEFETAAAFYNLREVGDMHHNPQKNVLHVPDRAQAHNPLIASARNKMLAARHTRKTPYVDKTIYTGWNAMCISATIAAARALRIPGALDFALLSLDRALTVWDGAWLAHVVAYGETVTPAHPVAGVLEDYALLGNACLDAWEATGTPRYFEAARALVGALQASFYDTDSAGFFDTDPDPNALGALTARRKPMQDAPTPAGNPVAAILLLRVAELTGDAELAACARATLESFAGVAEHFGLYAATYGLALTRAVRGVLQVCVVGDDAQADELEAAALARYAANKSVIRLRPGRDPEQWTTLPPALTATLPGVSADGSFALVCHEGRCELPVATPEELIDVLHGIA
jgi:uncharacterized protein YyaL (SSP411 family)